MITKNDCLSILVDLKELYPDKKEEIDTNIKTLKNTGRCRCFLTMFPSSFYAPGYELRVIAVR